MFTLSRNPAEKKPLRSSPICFDHFLIKFWREIANALPYRHGEADFQGSLERNEEIIFFSNPGLSLSITENRSFPTTASIPPSVLVWRSLIEEIKNHLPLPLIILKLSKGLLI